MNHLNFLSHTRGVDGKEDRGVDGKEDQGCRQEGGFLHLQCVPALSPRVTNWTLSGHRGALAPAGLCSSVPGWRGLQSCLFSGACPAHSGAECVPLPHSRGPLWVLPASLMAPVSPWDVMAVQRPHGPLLKISMLSAHALEAGSPFTDPPTSRGSV